MHNRKRRARGLPRAMTIHVLLVITFLTLFSSVALSTVVEEKRKIVFEYETGKAMAEFEVKALKALRVYGHVTDPFYRFHLPGKMILEYEKNNVFPGGEVPLTFKYRPHDGPGYEFEDKNGIRFGVDFTVFDWEFSVGRNFEEDFPAPMYGDYYELYDPMVEIWGKYVRCIGGFNLSLFAWEDLQGHDVLNMTVHIIEPSGGTLVYFKEKEEQPPSQRTSYPISQQYATGSFWPATLKIAPTYVGKIKLQAYIQNFNMTQKSGALSPGMEVNYVKDWFCNHKYLYNTYDWYEINDKSRAVPIDSSETEPLEWELESHPYNLLQNLIAVINRQMTDTPPVIGEPDTIITKIYNLQGDTLCRFYTQISLDYYLDDGNGPILIGNQTLNSSSQQLIDFNAPTPDTIEVKFAYDDTSPYWVLTKDHQWTYNDPNPRYICTMTADTATTGASCDNWVVNPELLSFTPEKIINSSPGNNISIAPFELPLPDFSVDSVGMQSPPYFQPYRAEIHDPDTARFDVTVTNRGTSWPPVSTLEDPEDYVYLTGRAVYESFIPPDSYAAAYHDTFDYRLITPMDRDSTREYSFEYVIPSNIEELATLAIHRICFVFETNGGSIATNSTVWERNFNDNAFETYHFYTVYPDSALPSDRLADDFENITVTMPDVAVYPPCNRPLYLYVADHDFLYSLPFTPPPNLSVEIGIGDWETPPSDPSWSWAPCTYVWDHRDGNLNRWKVYAGDLCSFVLGDTGYYSYCFRTSLNSTSARPTYLYVDSDGASSVDGADNYYYYDMAGMASLSTQIPGWRYSYKYLFQDNFPSDPATIESFVRADMAYDTNPPLASIRPGDSVVVYCVPPDTGTIDTTAWGAPEVYLHVKCTYIGPDPEKPLIFGPPLEGTYGTFISDDGSWTVILGEPAIGSDGSQAADYYMFDLNDSLLTRGYMIEYYFKSFFNGGTSSTLPAGAETEGNYFEFTCLPTLASQILYVDDHHGLGSDDGIVQTYIDQTFRDVLPPDNQPDRYDVNDPSALASNGLGGRAELGHLIDGNYTTIIWDSGSLPHGTICDGTTGGDKSFDCQLLLEYLTATDRSVGLWIMGDNIASDLNASGSAEALALLSTCGVSLVNSSYYDMTGGDDGGVVNPMIHTVANSWPNPMHEDQFIGVSEGGIACSFDVLDAAGPGQRALEYVNGTPPYYGCGIQTEDSNGFDGLFKIMWFGSSLMHIRDAGLPDPGEAMARNRITDAVLGWMGHETNPDITHAGVMPAYQLRQNYPNPFNPSTTIMFVMAEKGPVKLAVYNTAGQLIRTLLDEVKDTGVYRIAWDGMNNRGTRCASGVYFYRLTTGGVEQARKMVLLR